MLKSISCVAYLSSCLFLHISFSASYHFHLFSLNVLFTLKTLQGNFGNPTAVNNNFVIRGGKKMNDLVGYVK